jgi:hypothetical protein
MWLLEWLEISCNEDYLTISGEMAFAYHLNLVNGLEVENGSEKYFFAMESIAKILLKVFETWIHF